MATEEVATEEVPVVEPDLPSTELPEEAGQAAEVVEQHKDDQTAVESTEAEAPLEGDEGNPPEGTGEGG